MCDIFPDVTTFFLLMSLRLGMLIISILAIMTGVIGLSTMEQRSNYDFNAAKNVSEIRQPEDALEKISLLVPSGVSFMSCLFMFSGLMLLFGTLMDEEGLVQIFVWTTFLNIFIGFFMVLGTGIECMIKPVCLLSDMDWLSGAALLVVLIGYLFVWFYFICIANSYVTSVFV